VQQSRAIFTGAGRHLQAALSTIHKQLQNAAAIDTNAMFGGCRADVHLTPLLQQSRLPWHAFWVVALCAQVVDFITV